jgi:hypothetical protein
MQIYAEKFIKNQRKSVESALGGAEVVLLFKEENRMTSLRGVTEWLIALAAIIGAITTLVIAIKKFWKEIEPFWHNVLKPVLKIVAVLLTLIIPNGIIIWAFILYIAVNLTPGIKNRDVFLSVVFWLTICVSVCSLIWGMWFYPVLIRPWFNKNQESIEGGQS